MNNGSVTMDADSIRRNEGAGQKSKLGAATVDPLIDCDLHPLVPMKELLDRMSAMSKRGLHVAEHVAAAGREHNRLLHPTGTLRLDAVPPSGGAPGSDPSYVVSHWLDPQNIAAAILMPFQGSAVVPWGNGDAVTEYCSALNDYLLEHWYGCDKRFRVLVTVSPHDSDAAIREIERLADRPGVVAINIPLAAISLGHASFQRLYEVAAHHKLPIMCHVTGTEGNILNAPAMAGGMVRTYCEHHAMLIQSGQAAVAAITLSGALARNPDLRFVLSEFGFSWVPAMMGRMDVAWQQSGGSDGVITRRPSEYVIEQVRFTTQPFDEPRNARDLRPILDAMRADKTLLFSSDYPHWDNDNPTVIFQARVPVHLRQRVASENAKDCFGERLWH
jgi:predicted TIM-barrel fold metal-dependent hydrolase